MKQRDRILVVEDDSDISGLLQYNLMQEGFDVRQVSRGDLVPRAVDEYQPALLLLDLMLPGMSGLEVCRVIRKNPGTKNIPIVMLTARGEESDRIMGLELGADDYMSKPFSMGELIARVRALLRRSESQVKVSQVVKAGPVVLDSERHSVTCAGEPVTLTLAEFKLVRALARNPGRVQTRDQLLDQITGGEAVVIDRNVDVHIRSVRKKLGLHASIIETVRGVGYRCSERQE